MVYLLFVLEEDGVGKSPLLLLLPREVDLLEEGLGDRIERREPFFP